MTILAIDAGFQAMGAVVAQENVIVYSETCRTSKADKKRGVRVSDDDTERCQTLARFLADIIDEYGPRGVVVEMPSGGAQGARANRAMGMATAIVAAVVELKCLPLEVVTPAAVKKAATGDKDGSKADVEAAVRKTFTWGDHMPKTKAEREHVCDAAGALLAAKNGVLMRALKGVG